MKRYITMIAIMAMCGILLGCDSKPNIEVYVPARWTTGDYVREIKTVWCVNAKGVTKLLENGDSVNLRKIVAIIWNAERKGMSVQDINKAFDNRTVEDIIKNGI